MIVDSTLTLKAGELSPKEFRHLFTKLTFFNADRNEVMAYRVLKGGRVRIPRGAWSLLPDHVEYVDKRCFPRTDKELKFTVELDAEGFEGQRDALDAILLDQQGLVIAQPGFGKTQVALAACAMIQSSAIVFVHTQDIFEQWVSYAQSAIPNADIGFIQGENWKIGDIVIAMVQTVVQNMAVFRREWAKRFGLVIVDEVHHAPAASWEAILNCTPGKYRVGFTATESRADGMEPLMQHLIGPVIHRQKFNLKVPTKVVPLKSGWYLPYRGAHDWMKLQAALVADEDRNALIAATAARQMRKGHSVLVLSRRLKHLDNVLDHIRLQFDFDEGWTQQVAVLTGKTPRPRRSKMLDEFREGKIKCLLSTQLADEALDVPILSRVILTYPGKHDGRLIQQVGRALREHPDKTDAIIFDIVDNKISILNRQWKERKETYKKLKLKIVKIEEERIVSQAVKRREVAHRVRQRFGGGRRSR